MPAEIVSGRVAMFPDAREQLPNFVQKFVWRERLEIFVHWLACCCGRDWNAANIRHRPELNMCLRRPLARR